MIHKLMLANSPLRPSLADTKALTNWRTNILSDLEKRVSTKAFHRIQEKLLTPQQWKATITPKFKGTNIAAEDEISIEGWANAADPDRGRELIVASAWKTENYDLNPIILFNHNMNWPIGTTQEYKVEDKGLYYRGSIGKPSAYPVLTETQMMCRSLLAQGILRASSVGFLPYNLEYDEENDILRYIEVELLEISLVSVPMQQGSMLDSVGPAAKNIVNDNNNSQGVKSMDKAQYDALMQKLEALMAKLGELAAAKPPMQEEGCKEENKSLKLKVTELEKSIENLKKEKDEIEKSAEELIQAVEKMGIKLES